MKSVPAKFPYITKTDADHHALCGYSLFCHRFDPRNSKTRSKTAAGRARALAPDFATHVALARAHLYAARQLGFKGTFLAAAHRIHPPTKTTNDRG